MARWTEASFYDDAMDDLASFGRSLGRMLDILSLSTQSQLGRLGFILG
jgi:hypothetical protein